LISDSEILWLIVSSHSITRESGVAKDCSGDTRRAGISMSTQEATGELKTRYVEAKLTEPELERLDAVLMSNKPG